MATPGITWIRRGLWCAAILCLAVGSAQAAEGSSGRGGAQAAFARFEEWQKRAQTGPNSGAARRGWEREGVGLAQARRAALREAIQAHPQGALAQALHGRARQGLPATVAALLEEPVRGEATIRVQRDGVGGVSADGLARQVILGDGRVLAAHVYGARLVDQDFVGVAVHGIVVDGVMAIHESPVQILDEEDVPPAQRQPGRLAAAVGQTIRHFDTPAARQRFELEQMYPVGVPVPSAERLRELGQLPQVSAVRPNALARQRLNERRQARGLAPLPDGEMEVVPLGQDLETAPAVKPGTTTTPEPEPTAPAVTSTASVDNSALLAFPPIRSQGSQGSCAAFSTTYYQMTHMTALARGWDAKTGGDAYRFSPKWTYNLVNGGTNSGTYEDQNLNIGRDHGVATWAEFPYTGSSSDVTAWCLVPDVWRAAIDRRMNAYSTIPAVYSETGLANLKAALDNGYVLTFDSYAPWSYAGWVQSTVANDPSTSADDAFAGQSICSYVRARDWGHAMTIVGYNDSLWCDLNGNGSVDAGEKGALKIANSWGSSWGNAGYAWFAYDALRSESAVAGWNPADKVYGFGYGDSASGCLAYAITAKASYAPELLARVTVRHALRNQVTMKVGKDARASSSLPATTWTPAGLSGDGGALAFDGTTTACDGTFYLDFTGVSPDLTTLQRYFVGLTDSTSTGSGYLLSYTLVDRRDGVERTVTPTLNSTAFNPSTGTANASTAWAWVDYPAVSKPVLTLTTALTAESIAANGLIDAGETVTLDCTLTNTGSGGTTNLVATLQPATGLSGISAPQTYGAVATGASVTRAFSLTASGANGDVVTVTLQLQDGTANLGTVSQSFNLGPTTTPANPQGFAVLASGPAASYPSTIVAQGLGASPTQVTVTLHGLSHTYPDDLDVLLVGPRGQTVVLMSDVGNGYDLNEVTLTFDGAATAALPDATQIVSGTTMPTNSGTGDSFPAPAPAAPHGTTLAAFAGVDPNGTWSLYIVDDSAGDEGSLSHGWSLAFAYADDGAEPLPDDEDDEVVVLDLPTVALVAPLEGTAYNAPASVTLTATVVDNGHRIDGVRFVVADVEQPAVAAGSSYSLTITALAAGSYALKALVDYDGGLQAASTPVRISVSSLTAPWQTLDIGSGLVPGYALQAGASWTLAGAGAIGGTADGCRYVYQALSGDGSITTRVLTLENTGSGADAGVMIRENLTPGSRQVTLSWRPDGQFEFTRRTAAGGTASSTLSAGVGTSGVWVRLVRAGSKITASKSADGAKWTSIGTANIKMASTIWIGLVGASGNPQALSTSTQGAVVAVP